MVKQYQEVDAKTWEGVQWDDPTFLKHFGTQPLLIKNLGKVVQPQDLTAEWMRYLIQMDQLSVYTGDNFVDPTKEEFISRFLADTPKFNLLEGLIPPSDNPQLFGVPSFFSANWYSGQPTPLVSLVCTTQLSYTKQHSDPAGSGAWMLLLCGEKKWIVTDPSYRSAIYSPYTRLWWDPNAPHAQTKKLLPFCDQVPSVCITQRAGDLIWVPPGFSHRVLTTERAIGIGSFYMHPAIASMSVESYLGDASYHLPDAYLGHPNLIDQNEKEKYVSSLSSVDFSVKGKDSHFVTVLKRWKSASEIMQQYGEEVLKAEASLALFNKHQTREAHTFPDDAIAIHTTY